MLTEKIEHEVKEGDTLWQISRNILGSGISIFSLPKKNDMGENALTAEWEDFIKEVERCSATCDGRVSNLNFERYEMEDGCDLCGYTFDFDAGDRTVEFAAFYRLGKQNMSEVIGVCYKKEGYDNMIDVARYVAASFEDFGGATSIGFGEPSKKNVGADDWNYPELHNLFTAAMQNYLAEE